MTISAVVLRPSHTPEVSEFDIDPRSELLAAHGPVLYVCAPSTTEVEYFDYKLDSVLGHRIDEVRTVVIRCHTPTYQALRRSRTTIQRLRRRFQHADVRLLHWSTYTGRHELIDVHDEHSNRIDVPDHAIIRTARAIEFEMALDEPGATLPGNPEFHYEGPNKLHYERFVRAGYAFQSVDAMESVAFWLLPIVYRGDLIVLDSWTLLALGSTVATYASEMAPGRVPTRPTVACAEHYDEGGSLEQRLEQLARRSSAPRAVIVTSVHSTGNTERRLLKACAGAGVTVSRVVRIYANDEENSASSRPAVATMHRLADPVLSSSPGAECKSCNAERKSIVPVDPKSLLLSLTAAVEEARIKEQTAAVSRGFLQTYGRYSAVSLHRDHADDKRHHLIYIDVLQLLRSPEFREKLTSQARSFHGRMDVVLTAEHLAAREVGAVVADTLGIPHVAREPRHFESLPDLERNILRSANGILFVDDVSITGSRIRKVKAALQQSGILTDRRDATVGVLIGVLRPPSRSRWQGVADYVGGENIRFAEAIEIPNWGTEECPWCHELSALRSVRGDLPDDSWVHERSAHLEDTAKGISSNLFLLLRSDDSGLTQGGALDEYEWGKRVSTVASRFPGRAEYTFPDLGQGSIFGNLADAELFVAVASSLQRLRNENRLCERPQFPLARVLDPYLYFYGRFYANVILACILRASRRRDLRTVDIEKVLREACGERITEPESRELLGELVLAMSATKLPWPEEALVETVTEDLAPGEAVIVDYLINRTRDRRAVNHLGISAKSLM